MKNMKLIYIEWEDACSAAHWQPEEELEDWSKNASPIIEQVGWVYKETSRYLILVSRQGIHIYDGDTVISKSYGLAQKIPKTWIRKRKILKI